MRGNGSEKTKRRKSPKEVRAQAPGGQPEQTVKRSADAVRAALEAHAAHGDALRARVLELLQA